MAGLATLSSCHNCGKTNVDLHIVHTAQCCPCGGLHIIVACIDCKTNIWEREN